MKVILYMTITANGYIARENDDVDFASDAEWDRFRAIANRIGNMIIGRRTYDVMKRDNQFSDLENVRKVVLTHETTTESKNIIFTDKQPKEILRHLESLGFNEVLVAGGGICNTNFMVENLVDEIYLDIEPVILGRGIKLFADDNFEINLELIEIKELTNNEVQLHYK